MTCNSGDDPEVLAGEPGERSPVLCTRSNVVVITDEAHRSQYGTKAKLVDVKDRATKEVIGKK
jgi:type I restriction enzyme, R subunit